jgi:threonine synthase
MSWRAEKTPKGLFELSKHARKTIRDRVIQSSPRMEGKFTLDCAACGARGDADSASRRCEICDGPLVPAYPPTSLEDLDLPGMWRYFPRLPLLDKESIVTLGEGSTPRLDAPRLGAVLGLEQLTVKDETRNPTGSFKDRMLAVGISRARELGKTTVAVQSSGNVAAAAAAYAAKAGLSAKVFVPRSVPEEKLAQILMYGAELFRIDESSPAAVFAMMDEAARRFDWHVVATTALYNPFTLEGSKTIAYELAPDVPDWLIVPVGGGGNLGSLWRGFRELSALRAIDRLPRLVGVQAEGCAPLVEAMNLGLSWKEAAARRWPEIRTICGAIADDVLFDAHIAIPAVVESGGAAIAVSDEETLRAEKLLASTEGLFVEPSSATAVAALRKLVERGTIDRGSRVCCLATGTGLKDMGAARTLVSLPSVISALEFRRQFA